MTNHYYGSPSSDNSSHGYSDGVSSSESLTNPFTSNPFTANAGQAGYTHSSIPPSSDPAQLQYPEYGQMNYAANPVPQQQMMGYAVVPSKNAPYSKDKVLAAVLCWFLGCLGIHNFYTGHTAAALVQLISVLTVPIWMWIPVLNIILAIVIVLFPLVNFIQILTSTGLYKFDFPRT